MKIQTLKKISTKEQLLKELSPLLKKGGIWIAEGTLVDCNCNDSKKVKTKGKTVSDNQEEGDCITYDTSVTFIISGTCYDNGCNKKGGECVPIMKGADNITVDCMCIIPLVK